MTPTPETRAPFGILTLLSCDHFAECYDALTLEQSGELWEVLITHGKPLAELIDIEESCPNDALGLNTPAAFWEHFKPETRAALLAIAAAEERETEAWLAELES